MLDLFVDFVGMDLAFLAAALLGGIVFVVRLITQFAGIEHHDVTDMAPDNIDSHLGDSDLSFKLLTIQGVSGFLLMFGLVGLLLNREILTGPLVAMVGAVIAGFLALLLIQQSYQSMFKMQTSGNIDFKQALNQEGTVYLTIPEEGEGQIQIPFQNKMHIVSAVSKHRQAIPTGSKVKVLDIEKKNVLIVEKVI
jgi:membrane protein implicated in regulation of membrane protease activity